MHGARSRAGDISRRGFLGMTGGLAGAGLLAAAGCGGESARQSTGTGDMWKQFSGTTIQFISENTPPTAAIAANLGPFQEKTGIKVEISQVKLPQLVKQVGLDFGSGKGQYHVVYADPYQVLAPYYQGLAPLNSFNDNGNLPSIPQGVDDFIPAQLAAAGRFQNEQDLYALPYDCPTMIWFYRKDLFDKYGQRMGDDLGFDPTPSQNITWEQYYRIAQWFNDNVDEVQYGTGHQAKQHDSLMCDFSNVLWSFGGDYFEGGQRVGRLGTENPGPSTLNGPEAIEAAGFYRKLLDIAHPGSTSWDWTGAANAFKGGQMAMCPNWHENAADFAAEGTETAGKVGYAPLPKGPQRSANIYGGTGIGINSSASEQHQGAAWLFLVWATSPESQKTGLFSDDGGGTPTRQSVYEMPEVREAAQRPSEAPNMLTDDAVTTAWKTENVGFRPKIPSWLDCDTAIFTELSKMLAGGKGPQEAMTAAKQGCDQATGA